MLPRKGREMRCTLYAHHVSDMWGQRVRSESLRRVQDQQDHRAIATVRIRWQTLRDARFCPPGAAPSPNPRSTGACSQRAPRCTSRTLGLAAHSQGRRVNPFIAELKKLNVYDDADDIALHIEHSDSTTNKIAAMISLVNIVFVGANNHSLRMRFDRTKSAIVT